MSLKLAKSPESADGRVRYYHWCPGCSTSHMFTCKVPQTNGALWTFDGNMESPTFQPSMKVTWAYGKERIHHCCHYFLKGGKIQYLNDCTHDLKGQTVDLPDMPEKHRKMFFGDFDPDA